MSKINRLLLKIIIIVALFISMIYQSYNRIYNVFSSNYEFYYFKEGPFYKDEIKLLRASAIDSNTRITFKNKQKVCYDSFKILAYPITFENISPPNSGYLIKDKNSEIFLTE